MIGELEVDESGRYQHVPQSSFFLQGLIAGLSALPLSFHERNMYLLYHRDCLLRYLRRSNPVSEGASAITNIVGRFESEVARLSKDENRLAKSVFEALHATDAGTWSCDISSWRAAIIGLSEYIAPLCASLQLDPFAELPVFPILFKIFQGLANQVGIDQLNEAFLCHFLLAITVGEEVRRRRVLLRPLV